MAWLTRSSTSRVKSAPPFLRLAGNHDLDAFADGWKPPGKTQRFVREELDDAPRTSDLVDALAACLPLLARQRVTRLLGAQQQFAAGAIECVRALLGRPARSSRLGCWG